MTAQRLLPVAQQSGTLESGSEFLRTICGNFSLPLQVSCLESMIRVYHNGTSGELIRFSQFLLLYDMNPPTMMLRANVKRAWTLAFPQLLPFLVEI